MNIDDHDTKNFEYLSSMMLVHSSVGIEELKQACNSSIQEINNLLLKGIPGQPESKFIILSELLSECHVALPQNLQNMLSKYVVFPSGIANEKSSFTFSSHLPTTDCQPQPDSKPTIELSESITMSELGVLVDELNKFHDPIKNFISMLAFFSFHSSALFQMCLNAHYGWFSLATEHNSSLQMKDAMASWDLSSFVSSLENVQKVILKFLNGLCSYSDIVQIDPNGHLEIVRELQILQQYSDTFGVSCSSHGLMDTCSTFNLHKLVCQANSLIFVCQQFKLEECLKDSRLSQLQREVLELQNEATRSKLISADISRKEKQMKELLCVTKETDLQCLGLLTAIEEHCDDTFVQLMSDKQSRQHHKDIAKQLQHEVSAIKSFSSVVELMNPFFDADQKFASLIKWVYDKGENVEEKVQILKSFAGQLSIIKEVFSSESPILTREEKQSAAEAKEENRSLHEKLEWYQHQFKQYAEEKTKEQEKIDQLQKENAALQRKKEQLHKKIQDLQRHASEITLSNSALESDNQTHIAKIQVLSEVKETLQKECGTLTQENQLLQQEISSLQNENNQLRIAHQESVAFGLEPWKISRDKLKLGEVIGGGGYGAVSKGDLKVAVKQFYPTIVSPHNLQRLTREMKMLARIRHPNLVQFVAVVFEESEKVTENPPYIITELLDGSLREAYEKGQISERNLCPIFQDIARALDYLHQRYEPIIHRDVSSANVLLRCLPNDKWVAKVSDLGSPNLADVSFTKNEGAVIYCAPEAFTDQSNTLTEKALTPKVDVYSYGILLCEVVNSKLPNPDKFQILLAQTERKQPQLHSLIVQCVKQEPEERPTMAHVLTILEPLSQKK